jgi:hypothetical protein
MHVVVDTSALASAAGAVMAQASKVAELGFGSDIGAGGDPLLDDSLDRFCAVTEGVLLLLATALEGIGIGLGAGASDYLHTELAIEKASE